MAHMRLFLAGVVAAAAVVAATASPALACSCAVPDPRILLSEADGAFVGRLQSRRDLGDGRAQFTFRVERSVKGDLGQTVVVESASNGAACGLETTIGARIGLFLDRDAGRWKSSLCWQVDADDLVAATRPLPPPNGRGPAALLVGGRFGPVRLLALDALGRTLAYGRGHGTVLQLSVCPGKRRVAEVVQLDAGVAVAVRTLPGLRLLRQRPVRSPLGTHPTALRCETRDGRRLLLFHSSGDAPSNARLERLVGPGGALVWRGTAIGATLTGRTAYVTAGRRGTRLIAVDLATQRVRTIGRIPRPFGPLVANRTGSQLAGMVSSDGSRRHIARIRVEPFAVMTVPLITVGEIGWIDDRRFAFFPISGPRARIYAPSLAVVTSFPWTAYRSTIAGTAVYGTGFDGRLRRAPLPSGPEQVLRRLPGPNVSVIVPAR